MRSNGLYDFIQVIESRDKSNRKVFTPAFEINSHTKDIMRCAGKFYGLWDPYTGLWVRNINIAMELIDRNVYEYVEKKVGKEIIDNPEYAPMIKRLVDTINGLSRKFRNFVEVDMEDTYIPLDQVVKFEDAEVKREDYCSFKLPYSPREGPIPYFTKLKDQLYLPDESQKFCWMTGALLVGDQAKIQKFFVFYGDPGTGKSSIIKIVRDLLGGDGSPLVAKCTAELLVNKDSFGTDFLTEDPIFCYDDEASISKVDSRSTLNLIVSHEKIRVNAKFTRPVWKTPKCFLVCGANDPVQVSQRSGFIRRLIDIRPTGEILPVDEYDDCMEHIQFELPAIAYYCIQVYKKLGKNYYNHYIPEDMLSRTDPFQNFVKDSYPELMNGITLANAYNLYTNYCEESNLKTTMVRYKFRDTLKLYFREYGDYNDGSGKVIERFFSGFKKEKIGIKDETSESGNSEVKEEKPKKIGWLSFDFTTSDFDEAFGSQPAQYAKEDGTPKISWDQVKTFLYDLDTKRLHYVKLPEDIIVIDFDIKDENGEKSFEKNSEAANKFPPTYAELSKSGSGIHLHYIWTGGDPDDLSRVYGDNIEVKVQKGNAALRRQLTKCNDYPIAELSSGLPKKGRKPVISDWDGYKNEKILRSMIIKNLNKEYHQFTKPSIDYIDKLLSDAYRSGASYDVRDLEQPVLGFALGSHNKADYCTNLVSRMHFCSKDVEDAEKLIDMMTETSARENAKNLEYNTAPIIFFDIESYPAGDDPKEEPALLVVCWKFQGKGKPVVKMINPSPKEVESLFVYRMIGFFNRDYDNHILWARALGYSIEECNTRSQNIVNSEDSEDKNKYKFSKAYNLSYTDVYDFASAANKQSLKKWEIDLGIHHQEMDIPWDKPAPINRWNDVAEYCCNDVLATEAVFNHLYSDFIARQILADLSGLTVNDKTNKHTCAILTNGIKNHKSQFVYTKLGEMKWPDGTLIFPGYEFNKYGIDRSRYIPGVKIIKGHSIYKGKDPGEGGRKIGYPGMYQNVALLDVQSEHPHSAIRLNIFGDKITKRFSALVEGRVAIKHKEYDKAIELLKVLGKDVSSYFTGSEEEVERNTNGLADALKTAINACYGLTSAKFENDLRDPRNEDNIVAKYGALFMINLEEDVTKQGYTVVHCSTDSIKIANADPWIVEYVSNYGKKYGFTFEFEALYSKMTLVNEAVYIAKYADEETCNKKFNYIPGDNKKAIAKGKMWTPTGKQFSVPYVFKTLFSHEKINFEDLCETFSVKKGNLYLDHTEGKPDVSEYEKILKDLNSAYNKQKNLLIEYANPKKYAYDKNKSVREVNVIDSDLEKVKKRISKLEGIIISSTGDPIDAPIEKAIQDLKLIIDKGHSFQFIGRVGLFTPVLPGVDGGELVCITDDRYNPSSPSGSKDYIWKESELVTILDKKDYINMQYYRNLVDEAVSEISKYGDFEWFVSDLVPTGEPVQDFMNVPIDSDEEVPFVD